VIDLAVEFPDFDVVVLQCALQGHVFLGADFDAQRRKGVAHLYKVDRSTVSRMMTEVRLKQDLKGGLL
jgi:hypothetical protein